MRQNCDIPDQTSTADFENYLPTTPVLSSRGLGWQYLTVRTYQEPSVLEETSFPGGSDVYLVLVTSGEIEFEERKLNGAWSSYTIRSGDWFLSPAHGEPYELRWKSLSNAPVTTMHLHLDASFYFRSVRHLVERDPAHLMVQERSGVQDALLWNIGHTLRRELECPASIQTVGELYAETAAHMLVGHLLRHYTAFESLPPTPDRKLTSRHLKGVADFVQSHLNQPLSLEILAQQIGLSPYHFARLFRKTTGESPHQYVLRQRLEAASRLLKETKLPLVQIALEVGFLNQSHFTQVFKRYKGLTPAVYRQLS